MASITFTLNGERSVMALPAEPKKALFSPRAEVEMTGGRNPVKVRRVTVAFDCGPIHNPANLNAQIVGSIIMGLGGALREAIAFENGKLLNGRFQDCKAPRFEDLPDIEVVNVVPEGITESAGAGETPIIAIAPAIANAIFAITGSSPTTLPITRSLT